MNRHSYLRAYLAGIAVPTMFLLVIMTVFTFVRYVYDLPIPIERVIVFPMAVVPNLWGVWNMLYLWLHSRRSLPIGVHGAVLPLLLGPVGYVLARALEVPVAPVHIVAAVLPIGLLVYYLAWKYLVAFFNEVLGVA